MFPQEQPENNTSYTDNINSKAETSSPKNEYNLSISPGMNIPIYSK